MEYLPLFVNLKNRSVLIIGGGSVAARKIQILQKVGAQIKVVACTLCPELKRIYVLNQIVWIGKNFLPIMLKNIILVIVATSDSSINKLVYYHANKCNILINTVDDKARCSCIFPSIVDRAPILIGISSCGKAPVLTRILREKLESLLPMSIGNVAALAGVWRNQIKKRISNVIYRRRFWEKIFYDSNIFYLMEQRRFKEANKTLQHFVNLNDFHINKQGNVTLVGAGPGDKGLLTIRGLQAMQQADIILYDYLVSEEVLELARRDANKIYVGKQAGKHTISQKQLNDFIIHLARQGNNIVRLKGGDSFIFGRGGEELQSISKAGIAFQVVPGITSAIGASAYSGIPLTHREYAHSVTFVTGHNSNCSTNQVNWGMLSDSQQTLVIYMSKLNIINISKNLISFGRHINTPVAVISRGTYQDQKVLIGTLKELQELMYVVDSPALLIVGNVVLLHKEISWFGDN